MDPSFRKPRGRCACGAVRFAFDPAAVLMGSLCHCESCRRAAGAPVVGWITLRDSGWRWSVGRPRHRMSSPGNGWSFCGACGTLLSYTSDRFPGESDLAAAALADPSEFHPLCHTHWGERVPWLRATDDLPKHEGDPD